MAETKEQKRVRLELFKEGKKRCSRKQGCSQIKTHEEFGLDKRAWDNRGSICIVCAREKTNLSRGTDPEVIAAYRERKEERARLVKLGLKQCLIECGCGEVKPVSEFNKNATKKDGLEDLCRQCRSQRAEEWREKNKTYRPKYRAKKRQEDPLYFRLEAGKGRAKKAGTKFETVASAALLSYWKHNNLSIDTCYYCDNHIELDDFELDHGVPIERGGPHTIGNLFPSCKRCNREKNNKTVEEYMNYLMQAV